MMADKPIRVLHIVGRMDRGGIETMIMNLYRNIDRTKVQFDFLSHYGREAAYNDEIRSMGGRIYEMPALRDETHIYYWRVFKYIKALKKFFKEHKEYKIIHAHMTNTASIYMPIAKRYGVTCRIAHSHSTHGKEGLLGIVTDILQKPIYKYATDRFACSKEAAYWFYPKKYVQEGRVTVIHNAVDATKFRFSSDIRNKMRKKLSVEQKLVIGCVARFRPEKNQEFLLGILQELLKIEPDSVLMFVGDGPTEENVKAKVYEYGFMNSVMFLGMRTDIADILQAMDVFVLPSLWEGLPVTGIEAQAVGLHCVASDGITDEMNVLGMVEYLPLSAKKSDWAKAIIKAAHQKRKDRYKQLLDSGYDIHSTTTWLQNFYLSQN